MPNLDKNQKRNIIIVSSISALIAMMVFQTTNAQSSKSNEPKSMAWYTANIKVAEARNKECRSDSSNTELQATPDCVNALQALELSFGLKR
jgi:hypothetical protein